MSYELSNSEPKVILSSHFFTNLIEFGEYTIPMDDMCCAIEYILTNTDLYPDDPRIELIERIKQSKVVDGWNIEREPDCKKINLYEGKLNG